MILYVRAPSTRWTRTYKTKKDEVKKNEEKINKSLGQMY